MFRRFGPLLVSFCLIVALLAQSGDSPAVYLSYKDALPILNAMADLEPPELRRAPNGDHAAAWNKWIRKRDVEIRARLAQGDEDSVVNLLLFGTSFTKLPRATAQELASMVPADHANPEQVAQVFARLIQARADDLVAALAAPGPNERIEFARNLMAQREHNLSTAPGRAQARQFLLQSLQRVLREQAGYAEAREAARRLGNPTQEFAERSKLYRTRGLSLDTSLNPNLAIERSLEELKKRGLIAAGSVRRVAVVGPGLDFADKSGGFDFYPEQTIQPFALMDTLLRLGLSSEKTLEVATLDISPRVNGHITRLRARARRGTDYTIQLPLDSGIPWKPETIAYWEKFGDRIGAPAPPAALPSNAPHLKIRAVRVRAGVAARIKPLDLNIILQQAPGSERNFDLIVATNIFLYYDTLEQSLGLKNVELMLRAGGFLLTNNVLLELPSIRVTAGDYVTTEYSDRAYDGDHIVWYRRN